MCWGRSTPCLPARIYQSTKLVSPTFMSYSTKRMHFVSEGSSLRKSSWLRASEPRKGHNRRLVFQRVIQRSPCKDCWWMMVGWMCLMEWSLRTVSSGEFFAKFGSDKLMFPNIHQMSPWDAVFSWTCHLRYIALGGAWWPSVWIIFGLVWKQSRIPSS